MKLTTIDQRGLEVSSANALFMGKPFPSPIAQAGKAAIERFVEFFLVRIENPNTRRAYGRAALRFLSWSEDTGLDLGAVRPVHVAAYMESLKAELAAPSVKQQLAAIRELFDWLVVGQIVPMNPASSVRGPKHSTNKGKTIDLSAADTRLLLDSIDTSHVRGLRDRALIASLVYSCARVGAVVKMRVEDYYPKGKRWWFRLHEKGGKEHEVPAHHLAEAYLDEYIRTTGIAEDPKGPLFRSCKGRSSTLGTAGLEQSNVYQMIRKRAVEAGIADKIGCHTFRATGITVFLKNGGDLETAQHMANHASARTTKLYDRRSDEISLEAVERIRI